MKVCLVLCLATVAISAPLALEEEWYQWKQQHGKSYSTEVEESMRRAVWFRTFHHIQQHNNAASNLYQLGLNSFADMVRMPFLYVRWNCAHFLLLPKTHEEYKATYLAPPTVQIADGILHEMAFNLTYPSSLDWRMKGFVTEVCLGIM